MMPRASWRESLLDAAGNSATLELRTLPVLAAGPAFQSTARIEVAIAAR
jgi:hypothetical protein